MSDHERAITGDWKARALKAEAALREIEIECREANKPEAKTLAAVEAIARAALEGEPAAEPWLERLPGIKSVGPV
jgi:hypothetical protein